jgi:hypothetical protein
LARTFYRIVKTNPPEREGFMSYLELGITVLQSDPESRRLAEGLSVYATRRQARRAARAQPFLGGYIAELVIPDDSPLRFERTGKKPGHHTIWCHPPEALSWTVQACVASVLPVSAI